MTLLLLRFSLRKSPRLWINLRQRAVKLLPAGKRASVHNDCCKQLSVFVTREKMPQKPLARFFVVNRYFAAVCEIAENFRRLPCLPLLQQTALNPHYVVRARSEKSRKRLFAVKAQRLLNLVAIARDVFRRLRFPNLDVQAAYFFQVFGDKTAFEIQLSGVAHVHEVTPAALSEKGTWRVHPVCRRFFYVF